MTAQALKQAALDHLAAENASACSLPLGEGRFVMVGTRDSIATLATEAYELWNTGKRVCEVQACSKAGAIKAARQQYPLLRNVALVAKVAATSPVDKDQS